MSNSPMPINKLASNSQQAQDAEQIKPAKTAELVPNIAPDKVSPEKDSPVKISPVKRKLRKMRRNPSLFLTDSKAYVKTRKTLYTTWAKLGSFALVLLASLLVVIYYSVIASPRYVSQVQFVVKQTSGNESPLAGLAAIGASSPSMRDALILQEYIQSPEMALALDKSVSLKSHYDNTQWDLLSRLSQDSTQEAYIEYFQEHVSVHYDEMSEILKVEVQGFTPEFSLTIADSLMEISKTFINQLGESMANQQMAYAEQEVQRAHEILKAQQLKVIAFQDEYQLMSPEVQSSALLTAVHQLEANIMTQEAELKSLQAYMQPNTAEIRSLKYRIEALKQQLHEERSKLISEDSQSLNKLGANFKEIELNTQLSADLYASALRGLELVRAEAFKTLKHLLIIENPRLAEEQKYPERLYSIFTWFVVLILIYLVGRLIISIVKEHQE